MFATYNCCWLFTSIVSEVGCHGHLSCPLFKMVWISKKGKHLPFFMKKRSKLKSLLRVRLSFLMRMIWDYGIITLSKKKKSLGHFSSARRYVAWVCNTVYVCMIIYLVIFRLYIPCSYCIIFTDVFPPQATEESITECKLEKSEKSSYLQEHCSMLHDILMNRKPVCSFQVCVLLVYVNYHY